METKTRGERLTNLRESRGLTHAKLGKELGRLLKRKAIGKGTVWKWEQVDSPDIELDVFFALADLYEIDPRELATGKRSKPAVLSPERLALVNAFGRLPQETQWHIKGLIQAIHSALSPSERKWSADEAERVKHRDAVHDRAE